MGTRKILGLPSSFQCVPLRNGLVAVDRFEIRTDIPAQLAIQLRERELHAALLNPIDFARDSSEYLLIPGTAVASSEGASIVTLYFREGIREITSLAVDPSSSGEIVLARILLAEEFESSPILVPAVGSLHTLLEKADAALVVGDPHLHDVESAARDAIDLVEAWTEMTDLPYVYGVWCVREDALAEDEVRAVRDVHTQTQARLQERAAAGIPEEASGFAYGMSEDIEAGLRQFLHYAFYHGILPDIPEVRYVSFPSQDNSDSAGLNLN